MPLTPIYRELLSNRMRNELPAKLFGAAAFPFKVEPAIFNMARVLAAQYEGGLWDMYQLSNGAWYMSPSSETAYTVSSMNGFSGVLSADALGITSCLFVFSHLSFGGDALADTCAEQFHLLRDFAIDHADASLILAAID